MAQDIPNNNEVHEPLPSKERMVESTKTLDMSRGVHIGPWKNVEQAARLIVGGAFPDWYFQKAEKADNERFLERLSPSDRRLYEVRRSAVSEPPKKRGFLAKVGLGHLERRVAQLREDDKPPLQKNLPLTPDVQTRVAGFVRDVQTTLATQPLWQAEGYMDIKGKESNASIFSYGKKDHHKPPYYIGGIIGEVARIGPDEYELGGVDTDIDKNLAEYLGVERATAGKVVVAELKDDRKDNGRYYPLNVQDVVEGLNPFLSTLTPPVREGKDGAVSVDEVVSHFDRFARRTDGTKTAEHILQFGDDTYQMDINRPLLLGTRDGLQVSLDIPVQRDFYGNSIKLADGQSLAIERPTYGPATPFISFIIQAEGGTIDRRMPVTKDIKTKMDMVATQANQVLAKL